MRDVDKFRGSELVAFHERLEATLGVGKQRPSLVSGEVRKLPFSKPIETRCAARRDRSLACVRAVGESKTRGE